jgi:outer membrane protein assembly factor BamD
MKLIKIISSVLLCCLLFACSSSKDKEDKLANFTPETLHSDGLKLLKEGAYKESIEYFERINQEYPYSSLASKAQLDESYAYYKISKFEYAVAGLDDYISLYPGEKDIEYAYYLKAICFYDQIVGANLDQSMTEKARDAFTDVINRFPDRDYARDARVKMNLVLDHLAGKEMKIGRFYLRQGEVISAINRFRVVVEQYQTTNQIEEALYRLVEAYHSLGVDKEAKKYAIVLGNNYPDSKWYAYAYKLVKDKK